MSPSGMTGSYVDVTVPSLGYIANEDIANENIARGFQELEGGSAADDADDDFDLTSVVLPKDLEDMYTIERRDPKHRRGDFLFHLKRVYDDKKMGPSDELAFLKWVDQLTMYRFRDTLLIALGETTIRDKYRKMSPAEWFTQLTEFQAGVKYKGSQTKGGLMVGAQKYKIEFTNGLVMRRGKMVFFDKLGRYKWMDTKKPERYSTKQYSSLWNGDKFGIWVRGLDGTFYSNRMRVGRFQHSSFLNGTSVGAAGEWKVDDGIIKKISGRSGHYKPRFEQFMAALRELSWKSLVSFNDTKVMLFDRNTYSKDAIPVRAGDLLTDRKASQNYKLDPHAL